MRQALNLMSGQVHGKVDWINKNGDEIGMFLSNSGRITRCVVAGPEIKAMIGNGVVEKGMALTAHGEITARAFTRHGAQAPEGELVCLANRVVCEVLGTDSRIRGATYCSLKGTILHWSEQMFQVKTYLNSKNRSDPSVACSISLNLWVKSMAEQSRQNFLAAIKTGRQFTVSALVEASAYRSKDQKDVAVLQLFPLDFRLQG